MPYAIGLSLTVAYRSIRSPLTSDPEQVKESLNTRSKMLESLGTYWWTADAMAKLGRKALKSMQNPVGIKRGEAENLASAMESETTVCKYGPFEPKERGRGPGTVNGTGPGGLHLLSDAAATHSHTPRSTSNYTSTPSRVTTTCCASNPGFTGHGPSPNTDNTSGSYQPTPMSESLPTPAGDQQQLSSSAAPTGQLAATPAFDPSMFAKFDDENFASNFNELDTMFDGFYDLSMPTVTFQDFDGWGGQMGFGDSEYGMDGTYDTTMTGVASGSQGPQQQQQPQMDGGDQSGGSVYPELS